MPPKRKRGNIEPASKPEVGESDLQNSHFHEEDSGAQDQPKLSIHKADSHNNGPSNSRTSSEPQKPLNGKSQSIEPSEPLPTGMPVKKAELVKVADSTEDAHMEEPPRAGLVDPAGGYKTNPPPDDRVVRVYADGVFDLFHLGHMRQLEQAKNAFPRTHLTVGVTGNNETHRRKGLTVLSATERAESLRHCRWVDAVLEDCPWVVTDEFLDKHHFDYVAHDDLPYGAAEGDDIYGPIKAAGKFLVTQRTEGVSTTGIITKIVKDYNNYVGRQLKRGTSRQELNVSWLKKNELDLKRHVGEMRDAIRTNWTSTGQELGREINKLIWSDRSRPQSPAPLALGTPAKRSPSSVSIPQQAHPNRLEPPKSPSSPIPGGRGASSNDFATGYTLGLVGGIRSWMSRNQRNVGEGDNGTLDRSSGGNSSEDDLSRSDDDASEEVRGRQSKRTRTQ